MPSVRVKVFANLREITNKSEVLIPVNSNTSLQNILNQLFEIYPELKAEIMDGKMIKDHYRLFLNGSQVETIKVETLEVYPDSTIVILPPAGGG